MEKQAKFYLTIPFVAIATLAILILPLVAMQFSDQVRWSVGDFILMGGMIFIAGSLIVVTLRSEEHLAYRTAMFICIAASFLLIWSNLAVGLIGSGPNEGNLLYASVIFVLMAGIYVSNLTASGLERALFATALATILVGVVALLADMQDYPDSSVTEIIGVSLVFSSVYGVAGLLFRFAASRGVTTN